MTFLYFSKEDLENAFREVETHYTKHEEVPDYRCETVGLGKLFGVLEKVQMDTFYPSLFDKATYLFISINKGHFFSNGNKRLALVVGLGFLALNQKRLRSFSREEYKNKL